MAIRYFEEEVNAALKNRRKLSAFITDRIKESLDADSIDINYIFCNDQFLLEKNKTFLNHETLTDIITFDLSAHRNELIAEVYISVERVKENAADFKIKYQEELHRVIFHGILHLCGFKDKTARQQKTMRAKEQEYLNQYFQA